jgi:hypothetical protein
LGGPDICLRQKGLGSKHMIGNEITDARKRAVTNLRPNACSSSAMCFEIAG